ncbi:MAG: sigma-70 family RNA polymerase sigma factor [Opitutaceae bacterium]|nr:sigma-70 family RNA polymerase sigma factor [Opitutaceae bacterium]
MPEDPELLRRYAEEKSESAFAELVRRRVDLVYSVALRQVGGDVHLAEDVTQKVFADLARKAAALAQRPVLGGWLYRSTQFASSDVVRSERRRRAREQESQVMQELTANPNAATDWDKLRPLLDEAMSDLSEDDRDAVVLRYFEARTFAEIGRALLLTEEAARKRVDRALDKMAGALSRRGVTSTSAALGVALGAQALVAAPAGLAASVTGSALAEAAAGAGAVSGAGILSFMSSAKMTAGVAVAAMIGIGAAVYQGREARHHAASLNKASMRHDGLRAEIASLHQRLSAAEQRAKAAEEDNGKLLAAIRSQSSARTATGDAARAAVAEPLTRDQVDARWRRAQELAKSGDPAEALRELLWCFDEGMVRITSYSGVRRSFLLSVIAKLGETHPAALAALRERRDAAERQMLGSEGDYDAVANFGAINRVLKEANNTLAALDKFTPGDRRRRSLASSAIEELVDQRRYQEAMEARTFDQMVRFFASLRDTANSDERRKSAVNYVAKYVEILAGAGQTAQAGEFARQVLAVDASDETHALLQRHAARAGHPRLLEGIRGP